MKEVLRLQLFILLILPATFASYWLPGHYEKAREYEQHIQSTISQPQVVQLTVHPVNQNVREGRDCRFECLARTSSGDGRVNVRWSKDGQRLSQYARDIDGILTINPVTPSDSGRYICTAYYNGQTVKSYAHLQVQSYGPHEIQSGYYGPGMCQADERICGNKECVKLEYVCDGEPDCRDRTDEQNCPVFHHCQPNEFKCLNNHCVQKMWVCDGEDDCGDASDEKQCEQRLQENGCAATQFKCKTVNQCLPTSFHCDGTNDCADGSDEIGCVQPTVVEPPETSKQVQAGGTFKLTCRAVAVPDAYISWRLNWGPVCEPPRCIQSSERGIGVLTVTNVQPSDQGAYTCEAINVKGRVLATPDCIVRIVGVTEPQPSALCNRAGSEPTDYGSQCQCKPLVTGLTCDQCRPGSFHLSDKSPQGCLKCFCFGVTNNCRSSMYYRAKEDLTFRNNQQGVYLSDINENVEADIQFEYLYSGMLTYTGNHERTFYWKLPQRFLGNKITAYGGKMTFQLQFSCSGRVNNEPLVVIKGNGRTLVYRPPNPEAIFITDQTVNITVETYETNYYHLSGLPATREDLMMTLVDLDAYLIRATHCSGQQLTSIGDVSWEVAVNRVTNGGLALEVELCSCPPGYAGTSCEICAEGYERSRNGNYLGSCIPARPKIHCSLDGSVQGQPKYGERCECKPYTTGPTCNLCASNTFYLSSKNPNGCILCFCSGVTKQCSSSSLYRTTVEIDYLRGAHEVLEVTSADDQNPYRPQEPPRHQGVKLTYHFGERPLTTLYWNLPKKFLGNKVTSYGGILKYKFIYTGDGHLNPDDDVIIRGSDITLKFKSSQQIAPNKENVIEVPFYENVWHRPDGAPATRESLMMALSDLSAILIKLTHCTDCSSSSLIFVSMEYAQPEYNGNELALAVEQCVCPEGYTGTSCEECAEGWYRGSSFYLGICKRCECNGHASECNKQDGTCIACRDNTEGDHCEYCRPGFEGDARRGTPDDCLPARPPCNCNNHSPRGCDSVGRCLLCEHNTEGTFCERCKKGFYGDATRGNAFDCLPCPCPGSSECYEVNGQPHCTNCPPGFAGPRCEECAPGYIPGHSPGSRICQPIGEHTNVSIVFVPKTEGEPRSALSRQRRRRYRVRGRRVLLVKLDIIPRGIARKNVGDTVRWECRVTPPSTDAVVVWSKVGEDRLPARAEIHDRFLTISALRPEDSGQYRCTLERWSGNVVFRTKDVTLKVEGPPRARITVDPEEITIKEGQSASFHCRVEGDKCSKIEWFRDREGGQLPVGMAAATNGNMKTQNAKTYHSGVYMCVATLTSGRKLSKTAVLRVEESVPDPQVEPKTLVVDEGQPAEFRCYVPGRSDFITSWETENGRRLSSDKGVLRFPSAKRSDSGHYVCKAFSPTGSQPSNRPVVTLVVQAPFPRPIATPPSIEVEEHGSAEFTCSMPDNRAVNYEWASADIRSGKRLASGRRLHFSDAQLSDSGRYICVVRVPFTGETAQSDPVTLRVNKVVRPIIRPPTANVNLGRPMTFRCDDRGRYNAKITWKRLDGRIIPPHYQVSNARELQIKSAEMKDAGEYVCSLVEPGRPPVDSEPATLTVTQERPAKPVVDPIEQTVFPNMPAKIRCYVPNKSNALLQWRKHNGHLPPGVNRYGSLLEIPSASEADEGYYICSTTDPYGKPLDSDPAKINVKKRWSIDVFPKSQRVNENQYSEIKCIVNDSVPLSLIRWKKQRGRLPKGASIANGVLSIPRTKYQDGGNYVCYFTDPSDNSEILSPKAEIIVQKPLKPVVVPKHQTVDENDVSEIQCSVPNNSEAELTWHRRDGVKFSDDAIDDGHGRLVIQRTKQVDAGEYICKARDPVTNQEEEEPALIDVMPVNPVISPPDQTVDEGDPVRFICDVPESLLNKIRWTFGSTMNTLPERAIVSGNQLVIPNADARHTGDYYCVIDTPNGPKKSNPGKLTVKAGRPPQPVATPPVQNVNVGETATFNCEPNSETPADITWEHEGAKVYDDMKTELHDAELRIHQANESHSGQYVCKARNAYGEGTSDPVVLNVIQKEKPPTAEVVPHVWEGRYGEKHRFKCITTGVPTPIVTWEGPNEVLPENVTVVEDNKLEFSYGTLIHNGMYTCKAVNSVGKAEDSGFVNIEPMISVKTTPPGPQKTVPAGEPLNIQCDALGDPKPAMKWIHDPGPERGDLPDDYVPVSMDETIISHPRLGLRNSGDYTCQANSSFGIISKTVRVNVVELTTTATVAILGGNNQRFAIGQSAQLICVTSAPLLIEKLEWIKQDSPIDLNLVENGDPGVLRFRNFQPSDVGTYVCRAYLNDRVFATSEVNLYTMNSARLDVAFVDIDGSKIKAVEEGERIPLHCSIEDDDGNAKYVWTAMREGRLIKSLSTSNHIQVSPNSPSDYAIYRCEVHRDNELQGTAYAVVTVGQRRNSAPVKQEFDVNSEAHLTCPVFVVPTSTVTWRRENNAPLPDLSDPTRNDLVIKNFDVNDEGRYVCDVVTERRNLRGSVYAKVYEPKVVRLKIEGASGTVHLGRPAWLHCTVQGRENIPVVWKKVDTSELPDNAVVEDGRLTFDSVREEDGGLYECSAFLEEQSSPITMKKFLHVEKTKRKRKHILDKKLHKNFKSERKQRRLFGDWESTV